MAQPGRNSDVEKVRRRNSDVKKVRREKVRDGEERRCRCAKR